MDISTPAVSPLRQRMIEDMRMRRLEAKTQQAYVRAIVKLSAYLGRSPATATAEDLRSFQLHLADSGTSPITINATLSGLKFFFGTTLDRAHLLSKVQPVHVPQTLPVVLSRDEVARLLRAAHNLKHQTALAVAYATGLRASEVISLKVGDVDSQRMTLRVQQGKGSKDRYAMPLDIAMNGPCPPLAPTSTDTRPTTAMDCPAACDRGLGRPWGDPVRGPQAFCRFAHRQSASEEFTCPWDGAKRSRSRPCSPLQRCRQGCATRSQGCPTRRWQAHRCPLPTACSSGISVRQRSSCGCGQRV